MEKVKSQHLNIMDIYVDKNAPSISEVFFTDLGWVGVIGSSSTINKITFPCENRCF